MTKMDYAEILVDSPTWDGSSDPWELVFTYRLAELKEMYWMLLGLERNWEDLK